MLSLISSLMVMLLWLINDNMQKNYQHQKEHNEFDGCGGGGVGEGENVF